MVFSRRSGKIRVVYTNGVQDRVSPALLNSLIDSRLIEQFERVDGWIRVGIDPIRGMGGVGYDGSERRCSG